MKYTPLALQNVVNVKTKRIRRSNELFQQPLLPDEAQAVVAEDRIVEALGEVKPEEGVDLILTGEEDIGEVRTIEDPLPVRLQKIVAEIEHGTESGEEGEGRVHVNRGMVGEELPESPVLQGPHVGDDRREVRIAGEEPPEGGDAHERVSHRSCSHMEEETLSLRHDQLAEGEEAFVVGVETLDEELQLEAEDSGVVQQVGGHRETVFVVGMEGRKTVEVRQLRQNFLIPVVETPRDILPVGVIGINDGADAPLAEVGDALSPVERMEDAPPVVRNELSPDRVEQPVRKEVDVEVHERLRQALRPRRHQASPAFPVFFSRLASFFSFNVLAGFFLVSFLTSLSLPMSFPPV